MFRVRGCDKKLDPLGWDPLEFLEVPMINYSSPGDSNLTLDSYQLNLMQKAQKNFPLFFFASFGRAIPLWTHRDQRENHVKKGGKHNGYTAG